MSTRKGQDRRPTAYRDTLLAAHPLEPALFSSLLGDC